MTETTRRRAEEAMALLTCETMTETFRGMDLALVTKWRAAQTVEERELLHLEQQVLRKFQATLAEHIRVAARQDEKDGTREGVFAAFLRKISPTRTKQE